MITINPHEIHRWAQTHYVQEVKFTLVDGNSNIAARMICLPPPGSGIYTETWLYTRITNDEFQLGRDGDVATNYIVHHDYGTGRYECSIKSR